jgi:hypothetical protein
MEKCEPTCHAPPGRLLDTLETCLVNVDPAFFELNLDADQPRTPSASQVRYRYARAEYEDRGNVTVQTQIRQFAAQHGGSETRTLA